MSSMQSDITRVASIDGGPAVTTALPAVAELVLHAAFPGAPR